MEKMNDKEKREILTLSALIEIKNALNLLGFLQIIETFDLKENLDELPATMEKLIKVLKKVSLLDVTKL
jgi:hypothetical protein